MRVHELAKELGVASKDLIAKLAEAGIAVKNHMSTVDQAAIELLRGGLSGAAGATVPGQPEADTKQQVTPEPVASVPEAVQPDVAISKTAGPVVVEQEPVKAQAAQAPVVVPEKIPVNVEAPAKPTPEAKPAVKAAPAAPVPAVAKPAPSVRPSGARPPVAAKPAPAAVKPVAAAPAAVAPAAVASSGPVDKTIRLKGPVLVKDFAEMLNMRPNQLIAELMAMNIFASINQRIDVPVAKKVAEKRGFTVEHEKRTAEHAMVQKKHDETVPDAEDRPDDLKPRYPVVTFMGHVDHGKTSLLDNIRNATVAAGESGGITQHIGAYTIQYEERGITFLDTPGHAAFTAMRARGANLTDIVVLIVAADDGVMPQTLEALQHARAAEVMIMVAINKVDLPGANLDRVKKELQANGLTPEDWGGETIVCPVSAKTGEGVKHLLEMIILQADMLDLKANPKARAEGYVIEARMEPGMGPAANLLVTRGTLHIGDVVLCDRFYGKVRALISDHGVKIKSACPSTPVTCLGLSGVPSAGSSFRVCDDEKRARVIAEAAALKAKTDQLTAPVRRSSLVSLMERIRDNEKIELKAIVKADTQGSVEAITHALQEIKSDKVSLNVVLAGTGNISPNDIMLAAASDAVILGFHVAKEPGIDALMKHHRVDVHLHSIIYELIDHVRDAMRGLLAPEIREIITGHAVIKQIFPVGKVCQVAGCMVTDGVVRANSRIRAKRGTEILYEGSIFSLKHFKDSVAEVRQGQECGIRLEKFNNFAVADVLESYTHEEIAQNL